VNRFAALVACAGVLGLAAGCSASKSSTNDCSDVSIERFKELLVVDESVTDDARAKNATAGTWSFRHAVENMAPSGTDPGEFVRQWLLGWVNTKDVNGYELDRPNEGRAEGMQQRVICPWLKRTPANACNDDCSTCAATTTLDLAQAPFRLIGIANRIDLRETDLTEPSGEGRLLFSLTDGAADDPAAPPMPMTVIFEYVFPESRTVKQWAEAWHALGSIPGYDEPFKSALEQITNGFTKRGARPSGPNGGSSLGQIRTNESTLNWIWQLREFVIRPEDGMLTLRPLHNTPAAAINGTPALADWVSANADAILQNRYEVPLSMRAASADQLLYTWNIPGVDPKVRKAFAANTCNGCHSAENPSVDTAFHVSPFRRGVARVSPFLNDPNGKFDELAKRTVSMQKAYCGL
jgi:hypothetical protein